MCLGGQWRVSSSQKKIKAGHQNCSVLLVLVEKELVIFAMSIDGYLLWQEEKKESRLATVLGFPWW